VNRGWGALCLALAASAVCACGDAATEPPSGCRYDHRRPLPDDIPRPEAVIIARAERILRRSARTDRRSGLAQVLAASGFRIEQRGTWQVSDKPGHGRQLRFIGAVFDIAIDRPHPVDAIVTAAGDGWPPGSPNHRYSRRYGYVEYRVHLVSPSLTDLSILVDVRRRRVVEVGEGSSGSVTRYAPLPGQCPVRQPPPD
jgi:hypothetical protein